MGRNSSLIACASCVALFISLVSVVTSQEVNAPTPFTAVFKDCIRDINLPTIASESDIVEVLLTISQSKRAFARFLDCMGNKTMFTFRNSNDTTEWYMARVFDKARAWQYWGLYEMFNERERNVSCLTTMGHMDTVNECLSNATLNIDEIRHNGVMHLDSLENNVFKQAMCSQLTSYGHSTPSHCMMALIDVQCSIQVRQFVSSFFMMISCSYEVSTPSPMPSPITMGTSDGDFPTALPGPQGAIFGCLSIVYPGKFFQMLFPPSEASLSLISDITAAHQQHEKNIENFCSKIDQYAQCVTVKLSNPTNHQDYMLKQYVEIENFEKTFSEYCANKQLVSSQFQCTYRSVLTDQTCKGGMNDVITTIANSPGQNWLMCRQFKTARECRVNNQLKPCGQQYATVMEKLMTGVLNEQCRSGALIYSENDQTALVPCFGEYIAGAMDKIQASQGPTKKPNVYALVKYVLDEMEGMCSHKDTIFACMTMKLKTSTKEVDMRSKGMFSTENMIKILDFNCDMVTDLKKHAPCLIDNFRKLSNSSQDIVNCIASESRNITMNDGNGTFDSNEQKDLYCSGMASMTRCYTPILSGCDGNLRNKFNQLTEGIKNSCNNLSYKLEFKNSNSGSTTRALAPMALVLSLLLRTLV